MRGIKSRYMMIMGYLGAVIGAGFASGQEIMQFFVNYNHNGFKGAVISGVLFAIGGGLLMYVAFKYRISHYQSLLQQIMGLKLGKLIDYALTVFLFLGVSTMLSASGAIFYEHLYLSKQLGVLITYAAVIIFLAAGKSGMIASFNILVPVKLTLISIIALCAALHTGDHEAEIHSTFLLSAGDNWWLLSSLLYAAYNFALAMVVLTEYQSVLNRKDSVAGGILGGLVLGLLVVLNYLALSNFWPEVAHYEVPMLYVAGNISLTAKHIYTVVLWIGILTTAIASAYGFAQRLASLVRIKYELSLIVCVTLALPMSMNSFSSLVGKIYPIFGMLGVFIFIALICRAGQDMIRELYYNIFISGNTLRK